MGIEDNALLAGTPPKHKQYIEQIIEATISTPKARPITYIQSQRKEFKTRAQIHSLLLGKFGSGRTTSLLKLPNTFYLTEYTLPGIIGSISSQGKFIEGAIKNAAGKTLLIDEVQNLGDRARLALLSLLEEQIYSRALGYETYATNNTRNPYYKAKFRNRNTLELFCQFSCICSGVYVASYDQIDMAWVSRYLPIKLFRTLADIKKLVRGELSYEIKEYPYKHDITFRNYLRFTDRYFEIVEDKSLKFTRPFTADDSEKSGFLSRNCNDIARLACYFAGKEGQSEVSDDHYEKALLYVPTSLYNYLYADLGELDYKILAIATEGSLQDLTQKQQAEMFGVDQGTVSRHMSKLFGKGLLAREYQGLP